jgi:SAM-dependent methyltransferase
VVTPVGRSPFDPVAADYDAGRPSYPDALFAAIEEAARPLRGAVVLDVGAGTGIATRQLAARGARTVAIDFGELMLGRARARSPSLTCLQADGNALPIRSGSVDLTCFAQSWHWFDQHEASQEVARVLHPGGCWVAWWSHAWADGQVWFDTYEGVMEAACPGYRRHHRDPDWSEEGIASTGLFGPGVRTVVPWTRRVDTATWLAEERSKSYIAQLAPPVRDRLLRRIGELLGTHFPGTSMVVPYRTRMWLARRR